MIESIVAIVVIVLLVVFLTVRKKKTAARAVFAPAPKSATPAKSDAPVVAKEAQQAVAEPVVEVKPKQVVVETVAAVAITPEKPAVTSACCENPLLPQDSVLKRHYLHHIQTMVIELYSARPNDSILRRHYDSFIAAKIAECVASKVALQQLMQAYEAKPKTKVKPVVQTVQIAEPVTPVVETVAEPVAVTSTPAKIVRIPEDSTLKRHYMTQIHILAAAKLPDCPSDSILRRHYDALLAQEVEKQLAAS